jgi:hypothetical protein
MGAFGGWSKEGLLFCKKEAKNFWWRCRGLARKNRDSAHKSFLVLFFKKELLLLHSELRNIQ